MSYVQLYKAEERPAAESNGAIRGRNSESGSTEQAGEPRTYQARRDYMLVYQREYRAKRRAAFFADKTCLDCGSTESLELHHRDPAQKEHHVIWSWSRERREAEIAKCDVLCGDCHKRRHGVVPGGRHGGKHRYEKGCRCDLCVRAQRERAKRKPSYKGRYLKGKATMRPGALSEQPKPTLPVTARLGGIMHTRRRRWLRLGYAGGLT